MQVLSNIFELCIKLTVYVTHQSLFHPPVPFLTPPHSTIHYSKLHFYPSFTPPHRTNSAFIPTLLNSSPSHHPLFLTTLLSFLVPPHPTNNSSTPALPNPSASHHPLFQAALLSFLPPTHPTNNSFTPTLPNSSPYHHPLFQIRVFNLDQRPFTVVNSTIYGCFIRHYMCCKNAVLNHKAL